MNTDIPIRYTRYHDAISDSVQSGKVVVDDIDDHCREVLLAERQDVLAQIEHFDSGTHDPDSRLYRQQRLQSRLERIEGALVRLDEHEFGRCGACHEAIGDARLLALPYAELCLSCQRAQEQEAAMNQFPV